MRNKKELPILVVVVILILIIVTTTGLFSQPDHTDENIGYDDMPLHYAWEGVSSEGNPTSLPDAFMEIPFGYNDMRLISSSDLESKLTQSGGTHEEDGYPYQHYQFLINESIDSIQIIWKGFGSQPFMGHEENKVDILLYNNSTSNWDNLTHQVWVDEENDIEVKLTIPNISDFIVNESGMQNYIYILILGPYGAGNSTATLSTDIIEIKGVTGP